MACSDGGRELATWTEQLSKLPCGRARLALDVLDPAVLASAAVALPQVHGLASLKLSAFERPWGKWHRNNSKRLCRSPVRTAPGRCVAGLMALQKLDLKKLDLKNAPP